MPDHNVFLTFLSWVSYVANQQKNYVDNCKLYVTVSSSLNLTSDGFIVCGKQLLRLLT